MKQVFADAQYWVAFLNENDQSHAKAELVSRRLSDTTIVTTQEVLMEVLAFFSERGRHLRQIVASYVEEILENDEIIVHPQSNQTFLDGFALYKARPDRATA